MATDPQPPTHPRSPTKLYLVMLLLCNSVKEFAPLRYSMKDESCVIETGDPERIGSQNRNESDHIDKKQGFSCCNVSLFILQQSELHLSSGCLQVTVFLQSVVFSLCFLSSVTGPSLFMSSHCPMKQKL